MEICDKKSKPLPFWPNLQHIINKQPQLLPPGTQVHESITRNNINNAKIIHGAKLWIHCPSKWS